MAQHRWKTVSVRLSEEEENALKLLCEKRETNKHAVIRGLLLKELSPILEPGRVPEGEGLPLIGEHTFKYNAEEDSFAWQLDLGVHGIHALAEHVPNAFLENLARALEKAIKQRQDIAQKTPRKKVRMPKSILKYKVK